MKMPQWFKKLEAGKESPEGEKEAPRHFTLNPISTESLPADILSHLTYFKDMKELVEAQKVQNGDGSTTYILERRGFPQDVGFIGHRFFVMDYVGEQYAGFTEVDFCTSMQEGKDSGRIDGFPWIVNTVTEGAFEKRGFGARRMHIANQCTMERFGQPLHSGKNTQFGDNERRWQKLFDKEEVERTHNPLPDRHQYRFKREKFGQGPNNRI